MFIAVFESYFFPEQRKLYALKPGTEILRTTALRLKKVQQMIPEIIVN